MDTGNFKKENILKKTLLTTITALSCLTCLALANDFATKEEAKQFQKKYEQRKQEQEQKLDTKNLLQGQSAEKAHALTKDFKFDGVVEIYSADKDKLKEIVNEKALKQGIENSETYKKEMKNLPSDLKQGKLQSDMKKWKDKLLYGKDSIFSNPNKSQEFKETKNAPTNIKRDEVKAENSSKTLSDNEKIYIIVSTSLGAYKIQRLLELAELSSNDFVLIMRGSLDSNLNKIVSENILKDIFLKNERSEIGYAVDFEINPKITRRYKIEAVPAFVYVSDFNKYLHESNSTKAMEIQHPEMEDHYIVYGDVPLDYAILKINEKAQKESLNKLLKKLNSPYYNKDFKPILNTKDKK